MSATVLTPLDLPSLPIEAECITPDRFEGLSARDVAALPAAVGNEEAALGDLFRVEGKGSEEIRIAGAIARLRGVGSGMTRGRIVIEGDVGPHAGARMSGGELVVAGDAGHWAGAEMSGGVLRVQGSVGDFAGAGYPGARRGMSGGALLAGGGAGRELGSTLRRGVIAVRGEAGDDPGFRMVAGTILLFGGGGRRPGVGMKRGSIVAFGAVEVLPTFRYAGEFRPEFLRLLLRTLRTAYGFEVEDRFADGPYRRYSGDFVELGRGEIWQWNG